MGVCVIVGDNILDCIWTVGVGISVITMHDKILVENHDELIGRWAVGTKSIDVVLNLGSTSNNEINRLS